MPDLGKEVAIDSTVVSSHSNPNRKTISDAEASWTGKHSARSKTGGTEWFWGYKLHAAADANYGVPLAWMVTTASRNDAPMMPEIVAKGQDTLDWFKPEVVTADKGYDSASNHEYLWRQGIAPIINIRKPRKGKLNDGIYDEAGAPHCIGGVSMEYVKSHPDKGHLYRCPGCHLQGSMKGGITHCDTEVWEDPSRNLRLFGPGLLRRGSPEWKAYYSKRQAVERLFKSLKESRRLNSHCVRGLRMVTLHCLMSVLVFQATALVHVLAGERESMRWMCRRVA